jgi:exodeoxyribonuclease VII small subunit
MKKKEISYQKALDELESIVKKIEQNEPDVDELNDLVARAVELVKYCRVKLKTTEEQLKNNLEALK